LISTGESWARRSGAHEVDQTWDLSDPHQARVDDDGLGHGRRRVRATRRAVRAVLSRKATPCTVRIGTIASVRRKPRLYQSDAEDARRLFFFTQPALPEGWHSVMQKLDRHRVVRASVATAFRRRRCPPSPSRHRSRPRAVWSLARRLRLPPAAWRHRLAPPSAPSPPAPVEDSPPATADWQRYAIAGHHEGWRDQALDASLVRILAGVLV
jgi:hypothetical protein